MPKGTKKNSKSSRKPKKPCCGLVTIKGGVMVRASGPVMTGALLLDLSSGATRGGGDEERCARQATLTAQVAQNTCLLNGGTESECQQVYDETYQEVFDQCMNG